LDTFTSETNTIQSGFSPVVFKSTSPRYTGGTYNILNYQSVSGQIAPYDGYLFSANNFVMDHRGYVNAPRTGTYTLTMSASAIGLAWVGPLAFTGWNRLNADLEVSAATGSRSHSFYLVQGAYIPIRIMYANAQNSGSVSITLTSPNGQVILGPNTQANSAIIKYGCDLISVVLAPRFFDWGAEV
jgi:hypothetical protein